MPADRKRTAKLAAVGSPIDQDRELDESGRVGVLEAEDAGDRHSRAKP